MNVTFSCPRCQESGRVDLAPGAAALQCPHCRQLIQIPPDALAEGRLHRCLVCPSADLFVRKDFPQRLGVTLVALGILASCVAWGNSQPILTFAILFATAGIDVVLYLIVPDALMCYRCGAQYRLADGMDQHGAFDLEIHERYRQQAARMAGQRH
jgi:hypothetical protein